MMIYLSVSGYADAMDVFCRRHLVERDGIQVLTFNGAKPVPAELATVQLSVHEDGSTIMATAESEITQETEGAWRMKFGAAEWYDWRLKNWGSAFDAQDSDIDLTRKGEATELFVVFWSLGGFPDMWFRQLIGIHPELKISAIYDDYDRGVMLRLERFDQDPQDDAEIGKVSSFRDPDLPAPSLDQLAQYLHRARILGFGRRGAMMILWIFCTGPEDRLEKLKETFPTHTGFGGRHPFLNPCMECDYIELSWLTFISDLSQEQLEGFLRKVFEAAENVGCSVSHLRLQLVGDRKHNEALAGNCHPHFAGTREFYD